MRVRIAAVIFLLQSHSVWASDCAELNRQAEPNKAALQAATQEFKNDLTASLRAALGSNNPPMAAIAQDCLGVLHSIYFSLFISRADCIVASKGMVYFFCHAGMGISHFVAVIAWPSFWLN
ncbi:hypothetical protein [Bradyrhizobium sp. SBR1B]|uniref:hypothetical protein n=1 Tax=Bradyrhizobium sp. SBR1B TaxID=2663836 RepID=UPI001606CF5E|nr:hypothetical protein [Bradyrhizobium sp. SBR1B]MBB4377061.1 hypothetical protein [Bradyrhizobium sp. SBR1B]